MLLVLWLFAGLLLLHIRSVAVEVRAPAVLSVLALLRLLIASPLPRSARSTPLTSWA